MADQPKPDSSPERSAPATAAGVDVVMSNPPYRTASEVRWRTLKSFLESASAHVAYPRRTRPPLHAEGHLNRVVQLFGAAGFGDFDELDTQFVRVDREEQVAVPVERLVEAVVACFLPRRLADRREAQRLIVRDASRVESIPGAEVVEFGGYGDEQGARRAFLGVSTLFFCSAKESEDRVSQHRSVVDAAVAAGVERIVYLSIIGAAPTATFTFARDHYATEQYIRSVGLPFTFSRQSFYLDFLPYLSGEDGVIRGPAGDGRFAPVLRDDVADALVTMVTEPGHEGATYELTGPEAATMTQALICSPD